ncbi:EamA/RhaT family transporter [Paramagnetospirillum kuznetsovii]|uniref:EamA/RhaT family transporter n=1 Tax=Paramagnetospirillum kuznetsovii TaxID=2053833 RepID=A0A364P1E2_9PROT|nr:DMT family transporter [Paramagnetospirillum kuznetsovii]RAU23133.1 EamA/RhaT family transporter [Paramagnetospirillum kuznetsovii]
MGAMSVYGLAALAAMFWGANFNLAGVVLRDLPPMEGAAGRFVLAALIMLAITIVRREGMAMLVVARQHGLKLAVIGVVGIAGFNILFFDAMRTTSAVNGSLMMATNPLMTALLAALVLRERLPRRQLAALPVAFFGVAAVILGGASASAILDGASVGGLQAGRGDLEMLGANLIWAAYNVLTRKLMPPGPQFANVTVVMAAGALVLTLASLFDGSPTVMPGPASGAALLTMAVLGSVLAYLFWSMAITRLGAGRTALFLNLVPVFAAIIASLGGNPPSHGQMAGGMVVIAAVAYAMLPERRQAAAKPCEENA